MATNRTEQKTANLRFVERDGKRILQQEVIVSELTDDGGSIHYEWHDIPLESKQERHEWETSTLTRYSLYEQSGGIFGSPLLMVVFQAKSDDAAIEAVLRGPKNWPLELYAEREPNSAEKDLVAKIHGEVKWRREPK